MSEKSLLKQSEIFNPFIGPRSFYRSAADKNRFFGRDYESDEIISLIFSHQLVLIYAQSGTGKTSLFNAEVIPELESKGFEVFQMARISNAAVTIDHSDIDKTKILPISNMYIFNTLQSLKPNEQPKKFTNITLSQFLNEFFPIKKIRDTIVFLNYSFLTNFKKFLPLFQEKIGENSKKISLNKLQKR